MVNKDARVKYCRYALTGTFDKHSEYKRGNPTFFCLPDTLSHYQHAEDSIFHSIDTCWLSDADRKSENPKSDDIVEYVIDVYHL